MPEAAPLHEVHVQPAPLERFEPLIGPARAEELLATAAATRELLDGRAVWNVNSTATGGGVAEMLEPLLAYSRGAGVDTRWLVISGDAAFFDITKRLHNAIHGAAGDREPPGEADRAHYESVLRPSAEALGRRVRRGDVVLLHDPQTAGLAAAVREAGAVVVWRSHIGTEEDNEATRAAWSFLRPYIGAANAFVFSRQAFVPAWLRDADQHVRIIPPSIDPFSPKNADMSPDAVLGVLVRAGLIAGDSGRPAPFTRRDGSTGEIGHAAELVREGPPPSPDAPLVVQVSRWDRLKDMAGVMDGFARHVPAPAHLALVGPSVAGVTDDPEGAEVLEECTQQWRALPSSVRSRVQLACLPMTDVEENAAMVNAVQRHATVVVQKSLAEGFGLTVSEAMWKARPLVASRVGGIQDQVVDGEHGLLLDDPRDLDAFGASVSRLLADPDRATRLGHAARQRVIDHFLGSRHLMQYAALLAELVPA